MNRCMKIEDFEQEKQKKIERKYEKVSKRNGRF